MITLGVVAPLIVPLALCSHLVVDSVGPVAVHRNRIFGQLERLRVYFLGH